MPPLLRLKPPCGCSPEISLMTGQIPAAAGAERFPANPAVTPGQPSMAPAARPHQRLSMSAPARGDSQPPREVAIRTGRDALLLYAQE